jgi:hypothetical protein
VATMGVVLAGGICAAVLVTRSPTQGPESAGQPGVIPHLVPDVGGLHSESQGIRLVSPAGGPVHVYGCAGATFAPARSKR